MLPKWESVSVHSSEIFGTVLAHLARRDVERDGNLWSNLHRSRSRFAAPSSSIFEAEIIWEKQGRHCLGRYTMVEARF